MAMLSGQRPYIYCRLCLTEIHDSNFTLLDGIIKDMLEVILPELNFSICQTPSICKSCLEILNQLFSFKSLCLEVEDKLQDFVNPKAPALIDLKEVFKKSNDIKHIPENLVVCRTCLGLGEESLHTKLCSYEGDPLQNMVQKCLPEMDLDLTKDSSICPMCLQQLEEQFHFIMQCLNTEDKINCYAERHICRDIDLHNVYLFAIRMEETDELEKQYGVGENLMGNGICDRNSIGKSNAQRQKEYRQRKKIEKQLASPIKIPKTNAERQQQFRQKHKYIKESDMLKLARKRKLNAASAKRYRDNLKAKKQQPELDSLLSSNEHSLPIENKNCDELSFSQFQMQPTNEAQQSFQAPYEEHDACSTPTALLHHETNIAGDGNCLFSSLIRISNLQISASNLRRQLYDSPYLDACQNPASARRILSSEFEYGDLDCLFIFSRTYNQNVCVHFHYFFNAKGEVVRFCYFKVNDSMHFLHLHLRDTHFTPYIVLQEVVLNNRIDFQQNDDKSSVVINFEPNSTYPDYHKHPQAHLEFYHQFENNTFGHTCAVCDRLWWKSDLKKASNIDENLLQKIVPNYDSSSSIDVCTACKIYLDKKKIPKLSTYSGFKYPTIPSSLPTLNLVEQRLISAIIPFMQIRRQCGIYEQIINVPVEVDTMVKKLPRNIEDDHCFYLHGKKKLIYNDLINKNNIEEWLKYLIQTPLYFLHRIEIDDAFLNRDQVLVIDDISEREDNLTAQQQTLLWNQDKILHTAPRNPRIFDEFELELAFPTIYCGQFRNYRKRIIGTPFMQATIELRRSDRRGADPQHLLYLAAKIMKAKISQILAKDFGYNITIAKEQILRCIPNSVWYWAGRKNDLFAMIRQLGAPTAFMTLSACETGWVNLVKLLYKLKNNQTDVSDEFISNMNYVHKAKLVNEDLVTCAIYFNKLVSCLLKILHYKLKSPFGKYRVIHYFKRMEFQHCGSPRAHILLWLDNAPKNLLSNEKDVIQMIDELVSVSEADASGNIKLQTHEHGFTCYKKMDPDNCRFGAPFMPSPYTIALLPMKDTDSDLKEYKEHYKLIRTNLENFEYTDFHHFYTHNDITSDEHYFNIIRAGIDHPKLFYRRKPSEKWHNSFNPFVLHHLKSNMDFQIIQDDYACATYVAECVKHNRGISNLQRQLIQIMDENPESDIGDITENLLHCVEMSAQEAAWYLSRLPFVKSSTATVYIPTIYPSERLRIGKSLKELNEPDDDCTDIWNENWFDKYEKRPEKLNNVTLAQFVAKYYSDTKGVYTKRDIPKIIKYRNYDMTDNFDDYRREMVLLHIPFKSEENDILAANKFIEIYESNKDLIAERRKEFEVNLDVQKTLEICGQLFKDNDENKDEELECHGNIIFEND